MTNGNQVRDNLNKQWLNQSEQASVVEGSSCRIKRTKEIHARRR